MIASAAFASFWLPASMMATTNDAHTTITSIASV
jgi:hypothetical protein